MPEPIVILAALAVSPRPGTEGRPLPSTEVRQHLLETSANAAARAGAKVVAAVDEALDLELPDDVERWDVSGDDASERLGAAVGAATGPMAVLRPFVPDVSADLVRDALDSLSGPWGDAIVGATVDERWWLLGLAAPDPMAVLGLPLDGPGGTQYLLDRLHGLGLALGMTERLREIATTDDLAEYVSDHPDSPVGRLAGAS